MFCFFSHCKRWFPLPLFNWYWEISGIFLFFSFLFFSSFFCVSIFCMYVWYMFNLKFISNNLYIISNFHGESFAAVHFTPKWNLHIKKYNLLKLYKIFSIFSFFMNSKCIRPYKLYFGHKDFILERNGQRQTILREKMIWYTDYWIQKLS